MGLRFTTEVHALHLSFVSIPVFMLFWDHIITRFFKCVSLVTIFFLFISSHKDFMFSELHQLSLMIFMARDIFSRSSTDIMSVLSLEETLHRNQVKDVNISSDAPNSKVTQLHSIPREKLRDNALIKTNPKIKLVFHTKVEFRSIASFLD